MKDFKYRYQQAYDEIAPGPDYLCRIRERLEKGQRAGRKGRAAVRPAFAALAAVFLVSVVMLPVMAKEIPGIYRIVQDYAPGLADRILPEAQSDTSQGITMQVEAVNVMEDTAELIVSFSDAEGSGQDLIKGAVDLYDSYDLHSYGASYGGGGCSFLEYDEAQDKAYLKVDLFTDGRFERDKIRFSVRELLTDKRKEEKQIPLDGLVKDPLLKEVSLNGCGGEDQAAFSAYLGSFDGSQFPSGAKVMDIPVKDPSLAGALTVTGTGYLDGILRVQVCRGEFSRADRHMWPFFTDKDGNEREADYSVMWQEDLGGERVLFDEYWFLVDEDELDQAALYGIFYETGGSVQGEWEVIVKVG